jgi:hypothetical protein
MSAGENDGLVGEAGQAMEKGGLAEPVTVHDRTGWHRVRRISRFGLLLLLGVALAALAALWLAREPLADTFIQRELERRGVEATYTLDHIGLHNQNINNVVIGDPKNPDLVARAALIQMRIKWNGTVEVYRIVARGVRLNGTLLKSGRVSWGQVDKLLPPPSGKPFRLPDVVVDLADARIRLDTPYGRLGFAVVGRGNLTGGFKGLLATSSRGLDVGACRIGDLHSNVAIAVVARRPKVLGPLAASSFDCPASRIAMVQPRLELDSSFSEAFADFDGKGRLAVANFTAGDNGLANLVANIGFKGQAKDARGWFDLSAQRARLAAIFADRTRLSGAYRLQAGQGRLSVVADYGANSASLAGPLLASLTKPLDSASGTPLGPIAKAIAAAIRRTAGNFDASGQLVLVNFPGGGGVRVATADARGPNGARVRVGGRDGINYYWPTGRIRLDSDISMGGGGLPRAEISLSQPRNGGPMSGEARIAPYAAGGARVALAPSPSARRVMARPRSTPSPCSTGPSPAVGCRGSGSRSTAASADRRRIRVRPRLHRSALPVAAGGRPEARCDPLADLPDRAGDPLPAGRRIAQRRGRGAQFAACRPPRPVALQPQRDDGADDRQRPLRFDPHGDAARQTDLAGPGRGFVIDRAVRGRRGRRQLWRRDRHHRPRATEDERRQRDLGLSQCRARHPRLTRRLTPCRRAEFLSAAQQRRALPPRR